MGKYSAVNKLTKTQQQELFIDFATALSYLKNPVESANFIKDLLSEVEVVMLARRLEVARLLLDGNTYDQIRRGMNVSNTTIAKVHTWLNLYSDGYRTIVERTNKSIKSTTNSNLSFAHLKNKYPTHFWPELILDEIVRNASIKQKQKIVAVLNQMKEKTKLSKELTQLLQPAKHYHTQ
jgi:TrpR-related protein YerC/YecD